VSDILVPFTIVAAVLLAISAMLAVIRMVRGPSVLDRIMASDVVVTVLLLTMGVEMIIDANTRTLPIMLALAATASISTIAVARYASRRSSSASVPTSDGADRAPSEPAPPASPKEDA